MVRVNKRKQAARKRETAKKEAKRKAATQGNVSFYNLSKII